MKKQKKALASRKTTAIFLWFIAALFLIAGSMEPSSLIIGILFAYLGFRAFMLSRFEQKKELQEQQEKKAYKKYIDSIKKVEVNVTDACAARLDIGNMPELMTITRETGLQYDNCSDFTVIDVKTTGREPEEHRILEFAAVKFSDYEPTEYISAIIDPDDKSGDALTIDKAIPSLIDFVGDSDAIVAHNLSYAVRFLYANGFDIFKEERRYYDTREIAKKYFDVDNYKLETLCGLFSVYYSDQRRALHNCISAGQLYKEMLTDL